jgi:hypothetical protein
MCYNPPSTTATMFNGSQRNTIHWFGEYLTTLLLSAHIVSNKMKASYIWWTRANRRRSDGDLFQATMPVYVCGVTGKRIVKFCSQINHYSIRDWGRCLKSTNHLSHANQTPGTYWHLVRGTAHFRLPPRVYFCAAINLAAYSQTDRQPHGICRHIQTFKISIKYTSTLASFTRYKFNATCHTVFLTSLRLIRNSIRPWSFRNLVGVCDITTRLVSSIQQFLCGDTARFSPWYPSVSRFLKDLRQAVGLLGWESDHRRSCTIIGQDKKTRVHTHSRRGFATSYHKTSRLPWTFSCFIQFIQYKLEKYLVKPSKSGLIHLSLHHSKLHRLDADVTT